MKFCCGSAERFSKSSLSRALFLIVWAFIKWSQLIENAKLCPRQLSGNYVEEVA